MAIPRSAGIVAALALLAIIWAHGWKTGWSHHEVRTEKARLVAENALAGLIKRKREIKEVVVYKHVDRWRTVVEKGDTIVKEVPVYVTRQADAQCTLTRGFVSVLDAAASNTPLRAASGDLDAPATGLKASDVARSVSGNYTTCHTTAEQLRALQEWVSNSAEPPDAK
jgi:hypothetical protein